MNDMLCVEKEFRDSWLRAENSFLDVVSSSEMAGYELRMTGWASKKSASYELIMARLA
jgi:hypothetical protein